MSKTCESNTGLKKQAIVLETNKNLAFVKVDKYSGCDGCQLTGCAATKEKKSESVWALNDLGAKKDDRVLISQSARGYVMSAFMMFVLPVIILIVGLIAFSNFFPEKSALFIAIMGSILYYVISAYFKLFEKATARWAYKVEMVLPQNNHFASKM